MANFVSRKLGQNLRKCDKNCQMMLPKSAKPGSPGGVGKVVGSSYAVTTQAATGAWCSEALAGGKTFVISIPAVYRLILFRVAQ